MQCENKKENNSFFSIIPRFFDSRLVETYTDPLPRDVNINSQKMIQQTITKTENSGTPIDVTIQWPMAWANGQFFIVFETIQQIGEGGSSHCVKITRHALRTYNGGSIYSSSTPEVFGGTNLANTLSITGLSVDGRTVKIRSSTTWDFYGNGGQNHTFTVRIIQAPSVNIFSSVNLS
jgi:hypothetical protein